MRQEESNGHALALDGCTIHQFVLDDRFRVVDSVGTHSCGLLSNQGQLHVFYLDAH